MKWLNSHQVLLWVIITVAGAVAYMFTTFATAQYVDVKHESVTEILEVIREDVKDIKQELYRRGKK